MFVTNHVLAGALIGRRYPGRPGAAFLVGLGSHLAMDAVPHWGCDVTVAGGSERFLRAARRDGVLGLVLAGAALLATDRRHRASTAAAISGSVLLDIDKPMEYFFGVNPIPAPVQELHGGIQRESERGMPVEVAAGVLLALAELRSSWRRRHHPAHRLDPGVTGSTWAPWSRPAWRRPG